MRLVQVLIVDDDPDMRALVRLTLEELAGLQVAGEAGSGDEALHLWRETQADVVVLDQRMPDRTGLDVATEILGEKPNQGIVLFSAYIDSTLRARADALGICSVLDKDRYRELPGVVEHCAA